VRVSVYRAGGELIGGLVGLVLPFILEANGMLGRGKGLEGIFDFFLALILFPIIGLILGAIAGWRVARLTGRQQSVRHLDQHLLLKQLLSDSGLSETR
jgi:hypothetical protein